MSLSVIIIKTFFSNSLLIFLRYKSVNKAFYIRTNISVGGNSFIGASAKVK